MKRSTAGGQLAVRVFSATRARDRLTLGEVVTDWMRANPDEQLVDKIVLQSSDAQFHCLTIVLVVRKQ